MGRSRFSVSTFAKRGENQRDEAWRAFCGCKPYPARRRWESSARCFRSRTPIAPTPSNWRPDPFRLFDVRLLTPADGSVRPVPSGAGNDGGGRAVDCRATENAFAAVETTGLWLAAVAAGLCSSSVVSKGPQLISLRTIAAKGGETFEWHAHPFEEFTFVTNDRCMIGYPPGWLNTAPGTLLHYRAGEQHGASASPGQRPRFWVVHYTQSDDVAGQLGVFAAPESEKRVWSLSPEQSETFQWLFLQMLNEHSGGRAHAERATSSWLQLLLVNVQRWSNRSVPADLGVPPRASAEVVRLWHLVNEAVSKSGEELRELYAAPNYDSVRHGFRKAFGYSPRELLLRLRMEHAKNLLLESSLSIKEIAARVGYFQPHDFNRVFRRHAGVAPTEWRTNPLARSLAPGAEKRGSSRAPRGASTRAK
jgi:hypothetical protein